MPGAPAPPAPLPGADALSRDREESASNAEGSGGCTGASASFFLSFVSRAGSLGFFGSGLGSGSGWSDGPSGSGGGTSGAGGGGVGTGGATARAPPPEGGAATSTAVMASPLNSKRVVREGAQTQAARSAACASAEITYRRGSRSEPGTSTILNADDPPRPAAPSPARPW